MDQQDLIASVEEQIYTGKGSVGRKEEQVQSLHGTLDRFQSYLSTEHGIERFEDTTLDALRHFEFDLPANDDHHLRLVFSHLGRTDLLEYLSMVSADKYFRNKKLTAVLQAMDDLQGYAKDLRRVDIRMAFELLERGATPKGRAQLLAATDVPPDALLQMVQCCDLCRMTGMNGQTLRRSVAMGYDTLAKFRASTPEQIEAEFDAYVSMTGERTNKMVSFPSFIHQANRLEDVIVY